MKSFLLLAVLISFATLIVMAFVFRHEGARSVLRFMRTTAWVYVSVVLAIGLWRIWQNGGI